MSYALDAGRRMAVSMMTETVTVGVESKTTNPATGDPVRTVASPVYSGVAQVKFPSLVVSERDVQGQQVAATSPVLKLPVAVGSVLTGHVVRVTASSSDPTLVGRWFRVKAPPQSGQVTAHRYPLEEVT